MVAVVGVNDDELVCELTHPALSSVSIHGNRSGNAGEMIEEGRAVNVSDQPYIFQPGSVRRQSSDFRQSMIRGRYNSFQIMRDEVYKGITVSEILLSGLQRRVERLSIFVPANMAISPKEELTRKRIQRASHYFIEQTGSIERISEAVGYASAERFSVVFKQQKGVAPSKFRHEKPSGVFRGFSKLFSNQNAIRR